MAPSPRPALNKIDVTHRMEVQALRNLVSASDSDPMLPLKEGETAAVLATSPKGTTFHCLHPATGRKGMVPSWAVKVSLNDQKESNPFLSSPLSATGVQAITPPFTPGSNVQNLIAVPNSVMGSIVKQEDSSAEPPSPASSFSTDGGSPSVLKHSSSPRPLSVTEGSPSGMDKPIKRNPNWDRKYEEKRKAKGTRGHGTNFLKFQQNRFSKPYPPSIDALITTLINIQPDDPSMDAVFTEESLANARTQISDAGGTGKVWRVWIPIPIWTKFLTCRTRCAPPGTTIAEFAELLLNLGAREEGGVDKGLEGANRSLLTLKTSTSDVSLKVDCACATAEDNVNQLLANSPSSKISSQGSLGPSPVPSPQANPVDIFSVLHNAEWEVLNSMADSAFDPSLLNPLSGPLLDVFGAPFSNTPWSGLGGDIYQPPGNMNDLSQLLQLNIAPVSSSPLFNVGTPYSTPLVGPLSTPPQTVYSTPINFDYLSSFTNLSNDTSAMDFTNNSIGVYPPLDGLSNIQTSPPTFIHPFAPAVDPATAGFVPLAWTPPTLPGEYHPQATLTGWGSRRHHPYLRERAITPMVPSDSDSDDEVHEEKIHAPQAGETPHWAAGLGPNDWPEQVKREPPYAPPPETTELWIYYNNKTMKELAIARARKLEEDAGAGRGGKLERSFSEAQFKEIVSEEDKRGIKHAESWSWGSHRSHKKNHKEPSHVFSNAFNALKSLLSGAPPPPPKENPPPEPSLSSPSSPSSSSSRRKSGMFNRPRSSMDMLRRSFSMSRPPRPASSASINELASQSDNTVVDRSMTSPTPDLTYIDDERAESPAPPPKDDDDDEILEEILRKLKLSSPVSSPTANVAILPPTPEKDTAGVSGNVITVLRIFRPYIFNDTITKDQDPLNSRGRAIVSAGILKRLVDLKRVDADLVRACARRVAVGLAPVAVERLLAATSSLEDKKVDETMAPEIVFLERLAAVGLLKANLASAVTLTEVDGAYEWNEEV